MSHNKYLSLIGFAALVSWLAFFLVRSKIDPTVNSGTAFALFFISLSFALVATFTVIGFYLRVLINRKEVYYDHINIAFRQAFFLALIVDGCLVFKLLKVLTWWSGLLLIFLITMIEFYIVSKE